MLEIIDKKEYDVGITKALWEIPIGTVFTCDHIDGGTAQGRLFLRIFQGVVDLRSPNNTWRWSDDYRPCPLMTGYKEVKAKLIVEDL